MHVAIETLEEIAITIEITLESLSLNMVDPLLEVDIQTSITTLFGFLYRVRVLLYGRMTGIAGERVGDVIPLTRG